MKIVRKLVILAYKFRQETILSNSIEFMFLKNIADLHSSPRIWILRSQNLWFEVLVPLRSSLLSGRTSGQVHYYRIQQ